jgi:hypothetical protein
VYDGDGGDGGGGGDVVDGMMKVGREGEEGEYRGRGGSLWRIDGLGRPGVVVVVERGDVAGVVIVVVVGMVVVRRRGNSDLGSLLGRIVVTVVMRVDRIRFHQPY